LQVKAGIVSLGCAKNLVDTEMIMGLLAATGIEIVSDPAESDVIVINTCGFIEAAKEETVRTIEEMHAYGTKLVVCGCYAERYAERIRKEMPYVDRIVTVREYAGIGRVLAEVLDESRLASGVPDYHRRLLATAKATPYLKISDGCDNRCAYCAIPMIRGSFRSRPFDDVVLEAEELARNGAKELTLIGQDTTRYGVDLCGDRSGLLPELLKRLCRIEGIEIVRVLYLYPDEITDRLLETIAEESKIAKYFDIPVQHSSDDVLRRMNRRGRRDLLLALLTKIRTRIPEAILRTTLIVGFPGETEADVQDLLSFVEEIGFDRLGAFVFSREEGTPAFSMPDQIGEEVKADRLDRLMKLQKRIARRLNRARIGSIHRTIVEAYDPQSKFYYGRSWAFAPDDVDGSIVFQSSTSLALGAVVDVRITASIGYDLIGDAV
jgi:ribosomal protein S12 methylthiotransferase